MKFKTNVYINLEDSSVNEYLFDNLNKYKLNYTVNPFQQQCISLNIIADKSDCFEKLIDETTIKTELLKTRNETNDFFNIDRNIKLIDSYLKKNLYINRNDIVIAGDYEQILEFISKNDCLKKYKVTILIYQSELSFLELLDKIKKDYKDFNNLYIQTPENECAVLIKDYLDSMKYIDNLVKYIKSLNLSKMEQVMYTYDLVRSRIYKKEERYEGGFKSREITYVLSGDKIVCVGYTKLFNVILNKLGINTGNCILKNNRNHTLHMRSVVYIKDDIYNIEGIYYFDPTWDSKKNDDDIKYLNKYKYFAKTRNQINFLTQNEYTDLLFDDNLNNIILAIEKDNINTLSPKDVKTINELSKLVFNKKYLSPLQLINEKEKENLPPFLKRQSEIDFLKLKDNLNYFDKLLKTKLDGSVLFEVYLNVKLKQYINDDNLNNLNTKIIAYTAANSGWDIREKERLLLYLIFDKPMDVTKEKIFKEAYMDLKEREFDRNITGLKLAKVLKKVQTKKEN